MSARSITARRLRTLAATTVVAAVAGAVFVPATAGAAEQAGTAPLKMTLGAPSPAGPLERGGATESMTLTVTNSSDHAEDFAAWLKGSAKGPSPLLADSVVLGVTALDAPATKSMVGQQDGQWQGLFYPASGDASSSFSVPAKATFTWKVTVGLGAHYPTNDGDFTLTAAGLRNNVATDPAAGTAVFRTRPEIEPGKLNTSLTWDGVVARPGQRAGLVLTTTATGPGEFPAQVNRTVYVDGSTPSGTLRNRLILEAEVGGKIVTMNQTDGGVWELPPLPKGFGAASGPQNLKLYFSLSLNTSIDKEISFPLRAAYSMGDSYEFNGAAVRMKAGPGNRGTSTPAPSGTSTKAPSGSGSAEPTASASASASTTAPTAATGGSTGGGTGTTLTTAVGGGSLAHTGASSTGLYSALAGVLVALGGAAAWIGARRRRAARV
ncbi:LPXTG cell wall anchor domain-containing protein [Streptomyces sp. NPDC003703]|uniref:LPXTG cell wall anchor domain-containing protein n=1 Tax=Streptomyces sp. NPDC003283 TaxID=3364681 RepID=UPI0036B58549